jgi:hypothetical protein
MPFFLRIFHEIDDIEPKFGKKNSNIFLKDDGNGDRIVLKLQDFSLTKFIKLYLHNSILFAICTSTFNKLYNTSNLYSGM